MLLFMLSSSRWFHIDDGNNKQTVKKITTTTKIDFAMHDFLLMERFMTSVPFEEKEMSEMKVQNADKYKRKCVA